MPEKARRMPGKRTQMDSRPRQGDFANILNSGGKENLVHRPWVGLPVLSRWITKSSRMQEFRKRPGQVWGISSFCAKPHFPRISHPLASSTHQPGKVPVHHLARWQTLKRTEGQKDTHSPVGDTVHCVPLALLVLAALSPSATGGLRQGIRAR